MNGTPIIQFDGGNGTSHHLLGANLNGRDGYRALLADEKGFARYFRDGQWPRIFFKNQFGYWLNRPDKPGMESYGMWPDQALVAERNNAPFASLEDVRAIYQWWFNNGVKEVIAYLGRPDLLDDPLVDGRECVRIIRQCGPADKVSIWWDAASEISNSATEKLDRTLQLFRELRSDGHKIGIEAIPAVGQDVWKGEIDAVYCLKRFADKYPDRLKWVMEGGLGDVEVAVGTNNNQPANDSVEVIKQFPAGATRQVRRYWLGGDYNATNLAKYAEAAK